ncbi:hypothetical protein [Ferruginibacter albus]|uniref:hypothetical protein n=1 Tax=Ferruginibacter albus TaxID=2875540 RepID=UPI001CC34EC1|nr:hypothetical protein [Ferruginibacter albus]UAY51700.1 hypothetical protein K9M53_14030 [Ferruginibacter albus]
MKNIVIAFAIVLFLYSCASKTNDETATPVPVQPEGDTTKLSFFPVTDYLKGQALLFDSLLVTPRHILTIKEKSDTQYMKREELKNMLQPFFSPEIGKTNLIKYYGESKFNDRSLNAITLTYSPVTKVPDSIGLMNWTVYVNPETQKVDKIYIAKKIKGIALDTIQQLLWQTDKFATITTIVTDTTGKSEVLKTEKYIWSPE